MYTLFYHAHTSGSTVMRALAWEFPNDPSLAAADRQFFLGPALLVTPVLDQGAITVDGVFPGSSGDGIGNENTTRKGEVYYDWYTHTAVPVRKSGENVTLPAPLGHIPLFLRGGHVIPVQEPAMVTRDARKTPWGVIVALSADGMAKGDLYLDDGESLVQENGTLLVEVGSLSLLPPFFLRRYLWFLLSLLSFLSFFLSFFLPSIIVPPPRSPLTHSISSPRHQPTSKLLLPRAPTATGIPSPISQF